VKATSVVTDEPIRLSPRSRFRAAMVLAMAAMQFRFLCSSYLLKAPCRPADEPTRLRLRDRARQSEFL
jgi:hypothetical protein